MNSFNEFLSGFTFVDFFQYLPASGLGAHVNHLNAVLTELSEFLVCLSEHIGCSAVGCHPLAFRKMLPDIVQNYQQLVISKTQSVSVTEEDSLHSSVMLSGPCQILKYFLRLSDFKLFFLVHVAEGALVMGTAYGHLDKQAVSLTWGSVYIAYISHYVTSFQAP